MVKMIQIHRLASYVCVLQVIYRQLTGIMAVKVSINQNIIGLVGNKNTNLTCSFFPQNGEQIISVQFIAKNITEDFDEKKDIIAIFTPEKEAKLKASGEYLAGRVTLKNLTNSSNKAILKFDILIAIDKKDYICKLYYIDTEDAIQSVKSEATRILVKDPVRNVHINNQPNQIQYDRNTDSITLTCKASGDPAPEYKWFKENNNNTIVSETNLYVIEDVIRNNSGVYICEAHNIIENVYYTQSNAVKINIVDEMLILPGSASSSSSSEHDAYIAYTVPVILVLVGVFIVSFLTVRKHMSNRPIKEKNKESRWQNMPGCFNRWHGSDENPSYAVVDTKILGDVSKCMKENEIICKNKPDSRWHNMLGCFTKRHGSDENPSYAVVDKKEPGDVSNGIQENENICKNKVSYEDAGYSEVFNKANIKSGMSKAQTAEPPDNVDNNDNDSQDQFEVLNV